MRRRFVAIFGVVGLALVGLSACGSSPSSTPTTSATSVATTSAPNTPTTSVTSSASSPASSQAAASGSVTCSYTPAGSAAKKVNLPPTTNVSNSGTVSVTMKTASGTIDMTLNRAGAPCAVNSFVSLANQHYFDATSCHRLVPGFVLQCGDPTGTGLGGPGYSFKDELSGHETYVRGTVAMANAGPNTNGSQFFIVLADAQLPPSYDVLGTVVSSSMSVVDGIAAQGVDPNDPKGIKPKANTTISSMTIG